MGDTGSLAIGATLAVVALMTGQWLLLPVVGVCVCGRAFSVILQVSYFKFTHGKRLFKMSPLHHHFRLLGWSEPCNPTFLAGWDFIGHAGDCTGLNLRMKAEG
ncbi:MAG: hypothetical protein U0401_04400 [Anaerolineae bacterium]